MTAVLFLIIFFALVAVAITVKVIRVSNRANKSLTSWLKSKV